MREGLRRELLTQKVIEQEVGSKITVSDKDVTDFFNANRAQFNIAEESYHIAQIVVTPVREAQTANGTGDDATTPEAAVAKVRMLMERLKAGASFRELAAGYSEDRGNRSAWRRPGLRADIETQPGAAAAAQRRVEQGARTVNVASAGGAHTLVLVVAHEQAGQRDLSTPGVKERITETLRTRREQLLRTAYLTDARNDATVANYLAQRLVESKGSLPSLLPAAKPAGR